MIAIFISFLYFVYIFSDYLESSKDKDEKYGIFAASLIFSVASNGLISMMLIASQKVNIPIYLIQMIFFLIVVDLKKIKEKFGRFFGGFLYDFL